MKVMSLMILIAALSLPVLAEKTDSQADLSAVEPAPTRVTAWLGTLPEPTSDARVIVEEALPFGAPVGVSDCPLKDATPLVEKPASPVRIASVSLESISIFGVGGQSVGARARCVPEPCQQCNAKCDFSSQTGHWSCYQIQQNTCNTCTCYQ